MGEYQWMCVCMFLSSCSGLIAACSRQPMTPTTANTSDLGAARVAEEQFFFVGLRPTPRTRVACHHLTYCCACLNVSRAQQLQCRNKLRGCAHTHVSWACSALQLPLAARICLMSGSSVRTVYASRGGGSSQGGSPEQAGWAVCPTNGSKEGPTGGAGGGSCRE